MVTSLHRTTVHSILILAILLGESYSHADSFDTTTLAAPQPLNATEDFYVVDSQMAELIGELLANNPELLASGEDTSSLMARVPQERALPDPQLTYRYFLDEPETRVGPQRQSVEVSQAIPWFGKRNLQAQRASHIAREQSWRVQDLARNLVAELKVSYFDAAYFQEALAINAQETSLLQRFEQIALTRYATGEGIQQHVIKVQTEMTRLADQAVLLETRLGTTTRQIARLIGRSEDELALHPISLQLIDSVVDETAAARTALANNPGVAAMQQRIASDEAWTQRRRQDAYPDFGVGLGYTDVGTRTDGPGLLNPPQDNGKDVWALTLMVKLPLERKRIQAGIVEAQQRKRSNRHSLSRTEDRLRYQVQAACLGIASTRERSRLYSDVLIPQAQESLASAEAAYTTNRQGFLDLLDSERILFQVRNAHHRLLSDFWISVAELERTIAEPFPDESARASSTSSDSLTEETTR